MRNQKLHLPLMSANAWGMLYGSIFMALVAIIQGKSFNFDYSFSYVSSLLYLSIFGSVIAFGCYLTLLNRIGTHKTSYASIMFPAVAVIISTIVEDFSWTLFTVTGLTFIVIGNLVVLARPNKLKATSNQLNSTNEKYLKESTESNLNQKTLNTEVL
jgi:drug/metabolite transporter (DMT)-like permease